MNSGDGEGTYRAQVKKASVLTEGPSEASPPIASDPLRIRVMPHAPSFKKCPPVAKFSHPSGVPAAAWDRISPY